MRCKAAGKLSPIWAVGGHRGRASCTIGASRAISWAGPRDRRVLDRGAAIYPWIDAADAARGRAGAGAPCQVTENVIGIGPPAGAACAAAAAGFGRMVSWERVQDLRKCSKEQALEACVKEDYFCWERCGAVCRTSCFITPGWRGETGDA